MPDTSSSVSLSFRKARRTKVGRVTSNKMDKTVVVAVELLVIAWVQWKFMDTPPLSAAAKECGKIKQLSVAPLLARAVQSIHEETSVSILFES